MERSTKESYEKSSDCLIEPGSCCFLAVLRSVLMVANGPKFMSAERKITADIF